MQKLKHDFQVANQEISFMSTYMIQNCFAPCDHNLCLTFKLSTACRCMTFADCRLQTADRRPQTADCMRQQDCKLNETKNIVIKVASSSTLPCYEKYMHVRPRREVYIFHANYTDLIPERVVGCSSRIELEQNNVCRCHKLAHESIATG